MRCQKLVPRSRRAPLRLLSRSVLLCRLFLSGLFLSGLALGGLLPLAHAEAQVLIAELHYHPANPDGKTLEFVELLNSGDSEVDLEGWFFDEGIEFRFPAGARVEAGQRVVVSRNVASFREAFEVVEGSLYGNYAGSLDNDGETVALADAEGAIVDAVEFDDRAPWPTPADGDGSSLQRICPDAPSFLPTSWVGSPLDTPTPFAGVEGVPCPPPALPVGSVVISEIHYHPAQDRDELEEYVELYCRGTDGSNEPIDLSGWRLSGVGFTFPDETSLGVGEFLVVARNREALAGRFPLARILGDFTGQLSNSGERLVLRDARNAIIDSVRYRDQGDWSYVADGLGRSLDRVDLDGLGLDPANWTHSAARSGEFSRIEVVGVLGDLLSQRFVLGIDGIGEYVIDNVSLVRLDEPEVELLVGGDFEDGLGTFNPRGNAEASVVEEGIGRDGSNGLRLLSGGFCRNGVCGSIDSIEYRFGSRELEVDDRTYRLGIDFRHVSGSSSIYCMMLRGLSLGFDDLNLTPGSVNTRNADQIPPFISRRNHFPQEPRSTDPVNLSVHVRSATNDAGVTDAIESVELTWFRDDAREPVLETLTMLDDGEHQDGFAGDGVYGVQIPPQDHGAEVVYRIVARSASGEIAESPRPLIDGAFLDHELWGYYVNDDQPDSVLNTYHLLFPGVDASNPLAVNRYLNCDTLRPASFAYRGELYPSIEARWRGNTACFLQKRNFKLRFRRGRDFRGWRKLNLQSMWTDKSLVREHLAWEFMEEIGIPAVETEFIRVHMNGQFHGLFLYLEHPDQRWLSRVEGLDGQGCLYKAKQPSGGGTPIGVSRTLPSPAGYASLWERETCETQDFSAIANFIDELHSVNRTPLEFAQGRMYDEWTIGYQIAQSVLNNIDSFAKNHFLYGHPSDDVATRRWALIGWDMDLVFGKYFDPSVVDSFPNGLRPVGTMNDCMLSDVGGDLNPWFATRVNNNGLLHHYVDRFFLTGAGHYQRAYMVRLWNVLLEKFSTTHYDPILDDLLDFLAVEQADDLERWGRYVSNPNCRVPDDMVSNVEILRRQISRHRSFLVNYIRTFHAEVQDSPRLKITEIAYNPEGATETLEFVEIQNMTPRAVDVTGYSLQEGIVFEFPEATLAQDEVVVVCADPEAFAARYPEVSARIQVFGPFIDGRLGNNGDALRLVDAGVEGDHPATLDWLRYRDGGRWPDLRDGHTIELAEAEARTDNDRGESWVESAAPGGTPGTAGVETQFVRGDVDGTGTVNLTDPVNILAFLFQGGTEPACQDSADANDDGEVQIADAIYILNHLFLAGPAMPAPSAEPGVDPTADELGCETGV